MTDAEGSGSGDALGFVADLVAMVALVVSGAGMAVALVALLYTGPLIDGRPAATASVLLAAGLGAIWLALRSHIVPLAAVPQDAPAVVLVALVASVMGRDTDLASGAGGFEWVMVLVAGATFLSGVLMWVLGRFGLGEAVRYLPTVVVNAFVAGTGWLLAKGGAEVMVGSSLGLGDVGDLLDSSTVTRWLPGLFLALAVFAAGRTARLPEATTSVLVVVSVMTFYLVVLARSTVDAVEDGGWLIGPFDRSARPAVVSPEMVREFPWGEVGGSQADVLSLLVITLVALLLNLSALETTRGRRVDTGHELRQAGLTNVVISPTGAIPVFHALGDTLLAEQMGVRRRWIPAGAGVILALFGIVGAGVVGFVPVFVAGGLLAAVGANLLAGWVAFLLGPIGWIERLLSTAVLATIMAIGILEGVVVGLILACALFVFRYSRVDPIRRCSDVSVTRSRIERTAEQVRVLERDANQAYVFELQGYLFFGSTTRLVDSIRSVALDPIDETRTVVFDLRFVTGLEPGTATVMSAVFAELADAGIDLVVSGAEPPHVEAFAGTSERRTFATLEEAMAVVEDEVLARSATSAGAATSPPVDTETGRADPTRWPWLDAFHHTTAGPGTYLSTEGDPGDTLLFLLSGSCSVYSTSAAGDRHRVRQFIAPSWVGEIGFLRGAPRSADVVAETDVAYAVIDRAGFDRLREDDPGLAADLLRDIATVAADRTASVTNALTRALD